MYNKVYLIGRLGRDPEIRSLDPTTKVANFTLATNESFRDKNGEWQEKTEWHTIVAWRGLADKAERSLSTGSLVFIEGKITHRKYQDKEGIDRYQTDIVAFTIKPLEKGESGGGKTDTSGNNDDFPKVENTEKKSENKETSSSEDADDDLPF